MTHHRSSPRPRLCTSALVLACAALLNACALSPRYEVPTTPDIGSFKEAEGWVPAAPADALDRGPWWQLFDDPVLSDLQQRVASTNQNVAAANAAYEQARALLREQRASLFPVVSLSGAATRSGGGSANDSARYQAAIGASWEPDVWGRLREGLGAADASLQASAADLAAATLAAQGELALAYVGARASDAQIALLDDTLAGYERALQITRNRYDAGVAPRTDLLQAQTQLASAQADRLGLQRQRAQYEHAIAVLVGQAPASFTLQRAAWQQRVPAVPAGMPSTLLQRRPDIAAAERRVAAANAQIGIARSAYFPSLGLSASYGFGASRVADLFSAPSALWSLGVQAAQTLFDAGATSARVDGARAAHAGAVARYRQTVLLAFQDVEDQLAATRVLEQQSLLREQAAQAAALVETQVTNRYRAGQIGYTDVVNAQVTSLNARRALVQAAADRQTSAVALIQALGGGWQSAR
jgi:NodT family efflux transporter outer membrane factor (OMF) lipoprotein